MYLVKFLINCFSFSPKEKYIFYFIASVLSTYQLVVTSFNKNEVFNYVVFFLLLLIKCAVFLFFFIRIKFSFSTYFSVMFLNFSVKIQLMHFFLRCTRNFWVINALWFDVILTFWKPHFLKSLEILKFNDNFKLDGCSYK